MQETKFAKVDLDFLIQTNDQDLVEKPRQIQEDSHALSHAIIDSI